MTPSFKQVDNFYLLFVIKRFFCIVFVCANLHTLTEYKEYDGCFLDHYAPWFFWFFFTIGIFVVAGGVGMIIAQSCGK